MAAANPKVACRMMWCPPRVPGGGVLPRRAASRLTGGGHGWIAAEHSTVDARVRRDYASRRRGVASMTAPPPWTWPQPLDPLGSVTASACMAAIPLAVLLLVMGGLRKSGLAAASWALGVAAILAVTTWGMPARLLLASAIYGAAYAVYPILYVVWAALCLYNLTRAT